MKLHQSIWRFENGWPKCWQRQRRAQQLSRETLFPKPFSIISSVKQLPEIQSTFLDACIVSAEVSEGFDFDIRGHGEAARSGWWRCRDERLVTTRLWATCVACRQPCCAVLLLQRRQKIEKKSGRKKNNHSEESQCGAEDVFLSHFYSEGSVISWNTTEVPCNFFWRDSWDWNPIWFSFRG